MIVVRMSWPRWAQVRWTDRRLWAGVAGLGLVLAASAWWVQSSTWSDSLADITSIAANVRAQPDTAVFGSGLDGAAAREMDANGLPHPHGFPVLPIGAQVRVAGDADHMKAYLSVDDLSAGDCRAPLTPGFTPDPSITPAWVNKHPIDVPTLAGTAQDACTSAMGLSVMWVVQLPG